MTVALAILEWWLSLTFVVFSGSFTALGLSGQSSRCVCGFRGEGMRRFQSTAQTAGKRQIIQT